MYLSRLILNPNTKAVIRDTNNINDMHRTIMSCFPQKKSDTPRADMGILYRLEVIPEKHKEPVLYVQSKVEPMWECLPEKYLHIPVEVKEIGKLLSRLEEGEVLYFTLVANPSIKNGSKRTALIGAEKRLAWLQREGDKYGFALYPDVFVGRDLEKYRYGEKVVVSARFSGHLRITNANAFAQGLSHGIGPAKAYGCGLLSLAPAVLNE